MRKLLRTSLALAFTLMGCGPMSRPTSFYTVKGGNPQHDEKVPEVSQEEWSLARARLERMRRSLPKRPYVERVQVGMVDPRSGKLFQARGAVAVSPGHAARLILLGPGGTTAIDLWVTPDRFRFVVPAMKFEKRGGTSAEDARGLPIGFLRWWFLSPLSGTLGLARSTESEASFLLRNGAATVTLRTDGQHFLAVRREDGRLEGLEWAGERGLAPQAGARGRYVENEWGMVVFVIVEEVLPDEPDPAAFFDPDQASTNL